MRRFLIRRALQSIFVIFGVASVTFLVLRLVPGDPARLMVPVGSSDAVVDAIRERLGTDEPVPVQFGTFLSGLVRGDLGVSYRSDASVADLLTEAVPATVALAATSMLLAIVVAVPLGVFAAVQSGGLVDRGILIFSLVGQSVPNFWLGAMLILVFSSTLGWFPAVGLAGASSFVLPTITLAAVLIAILVRTTRQGMLEALNEDYIRTARAKGLPRRRVVYHAFRNALVPLITVIGLQAGFVLGGAFVVEVVFNWPGMGLLAVQAMQQRDFPVVQGTVIVAAAGFVAANFAVDVLYAYLNPRVRLGAEG